MRTTAAGDAIRIRGARTHNLQNIDVDLPLGQLIVMTGVSGSGKSSLAFDTLFAEGQRRYLDSISVHTRSLLKQLPRPDVDEVSGLPPTVSVDQRVSIAPARSTLAVTTDVYDYLRLLYARAGTAHCTECGKAVVSQSVDQIRDRLLQLPDRSKLMILSPMVRSRRGGHKDVLERIGNSGFVRLRIDGQLYDIGDVPELERTKAHTIDAVVDRIIIRDGIGQRLRESIELAVRESDGTCIVCEQQDGKWVDRLFSTSFSCPDCDLSFPALEPRTFSFNSAWGACPECEGFGVRGIVDDTDDITVFRQAACSSCRGSRLQPFAAGVTFLGLKLADFTALNVADAMTQVDNWMDSLQESDSTSQETEQIAAKTLPDIRQRLQCLSDVGIAYLNLNRVTRTLSGGEFQRARLASCLGTGVFGACFVLDEPTAGLHPRDTHRLLQLLRAIRDAGATVVVVEHDGDVMRSADFLLDLGPGAGLDGGRLLFAGSPEDAAATAQSPTGDYLRGITLHTTEPRSSRGLFDDGNPDVADSPSLTICNARLNNLQNITVDMPLKQLVCVTGVSGSGKSSLIMDTLLPVARAACHSGKQLPTVLADVQCDAITGLHQIQRVVAVDNSPLGRNRRSCLATYSGLWDQLRKLFAKTRIARARGFTARQFSFNSGDGRCPECKGTGVLDLQMTFLPDASVPCPQCHGQRFTAATLAVKFAEHSPADVLELRVDEAVEVFAEFTAVRKCLQTFCDVGLGYIQLGQPASTFSGGESQRIRLATELSTPHSEHTLFVLDEPTSGLHPADILRLNNVLLGLVNAGHSVFVIEHSIDVMRAAGWIIDVGPESSAQGGRIVCCGTAEEVSAQSDSHTGAALRFAGTAH